MKNWTLALVIGRNIKTVAIIAIATLALFSTKPARANSLDTLSASSIIQQVLSTGDIHLLGVGFGFDTNASINATTNFTNSGFSLNLSGTYLTNSFNYTYTGDTSNFSSNGQITWTTSGVWGSSLLNGNGSASYNPSSTDLNYQGTVKLIDVSPGNNVNQVKSTQRIVLNGTPNQTVTGKGTGTGEVTKENSIIITIPTESASSTTNSPTGIIWDGSYNSDRGINKVYNASMTCNPSCSGTFPVTQEVPEPLTILGSAAALGSSGLLAKEYSKIKKKKKDKDGAD